MYNRKLKTKRTSRLKERLENRTNLRIMHKKIL